MPGYEKPTNRLKEGNGIKWGRRPWFPAVPLSLPAWRRFCFKSTFISSHWMARRRFVGLRQREAAVILRTPVCFCFWRGTTSAETVTELRIFGSWLEEPFSHLGLILFQRSPSGEEKKKTFLYTWITEHVSSVCPSMLSASVRWLADTKLRK